MLLFKYTENSNFENASPMRSDLVIQGWTSIMWVERFLRPGEFELIAPLASGLREMLPGGSYITHTNSREIMVVENHDIKPQQDAGPILTITGRSLDVLLQERMLGYDTVDYRTGNGTGWDKKTHTINSGNAGDQIKQLIEESITDQQKNDGMPFVGLSVVKDTPISDGNTLPAMSLDVTGQTIHSVASEIAKSNHLGFAIDRKIDPDEKATFLISEGRDRARRVSFSNEEGELKSADYFYSIRNRKNVIFWTSTWLQGSYPRDITPLDIPDSVRMIYLDVSDLDSDVERSDGQDENAIPDKLTSQKRASIVSAAEVRAARQLESGHDLEITNVTIAPNTTRFQFRKDYLLGDLVGVVGSYSTKSKMRVIEHVEVEDSLGTQNYPTLEAYPGIDMQEGGLNE
jgi:hypothetical protein